MVGRRLGWYRLITAIIASPIAGSSVKANSYGVGGAHVTFVEGTYSPDTVKFGVDRAAGACAAGAFLNFDVSASNDVAKAAKAAAMLSVLIAAKVANTPIDFGGDDNGCKVHYVVGR